MQRAWCYRAMVPIPPNGPSRPLSSFLFFLRHLNSRILTFSRPPAPSSSSSTGSLSSQGSIYSSNSNSNSAPAHQLLLLLILILLCSTFVYIYIQTVEPHQPGSIKRKLLDSRLLSNSVPFPSYCLVTVITYRLLALWSFIHSFFIL